MTPKVGAFRFEFDGSVVDGLRLERRDCTDFVLVATEGGCCVLGDGDLDGVGAGGGDPVVGLTTGDDGETTPALTGAREDAIKTCFCFIGFQSIPEFSFSGSNPGSSSVS